MKIESPRVLFFAFLAMAIVSAGCKSNPISPHIPHPEAGLWTIYTPYNWAHDGQPITSTYCIIYSDDASQEMKQQMAAIADENFHRILQLFDFHDVSSFRYPPGGSKIEIYINRNHSEGINWAYWGGFIITIRSADIGGHWYDYTVYTARHELTHIFEFLIEGREILGTDFWFKEGIAVHVGCLESSAYRTVQNLSELESWISQNRDVPGQGNPIKIHQYEDLPAGADIHQYCRFSELAVRYLLDGRGLGKSFPDVRNVFLDLRDGKPFSVSFQDNFGITISAFEIEFYNRMRAYLGGGFRYE
jgi:hypothetical protein